MKWEEKQQLELGIVADLRDHSLRYIDIALRHKCGLNLICYIAKKHGLSRKRGPRSESVTHGE